MPQGHKINYPGKPQRQAQHPEEGYEYRSVPENEAEARAWATVNAVDHGGNRTNRAPAKKGGRKPAGSSVGAAAGREPL